MGIYRLKRKIFTKYDDTDVLKRAKDSDILAEKAKKPMTNGSAIATGAIGAAGVGALAGVGLGLARGSGGIFNKARYAQVSGRLVKGGALAGALVGTAAMLHKRGKEKQENEFYNRRLAYAQRQAMRREKADWKANMTQRDGYSY